MGDFLSIGESSSEVSHVSVDFFHLCFHEYVHQRMFSQLLFNIFQVCTGVLSGERAVNISDQATEGIFFLYQISREPLIG